MNVEKVPTNPLVNSCIKSDQHTDKELKEMAKEINLMARDIIIGVGITVAYMTLPALIMGTEIMKDLAFLSFGTSLAFGAGSAVGLRSASRQLNDNNICYGALCGFTLGRVISTKTGIDPLLTTLPGIVSGAILGRLYTVLSEKT